MNVRKNRGLGARFACSNESGWERDEPIMSASRGVCQLGQSLLLIPALVFVAPALLPYKWSHFRGVDLTGKLCCGQMFVSEVSGVKDEGMWCRR